MGSKLAFESMSRAPLIFTSWCVSLQQAEITGLVLTGRFISLPVVVHSARYPPGKANRVAAYQWQKKLRPYTGSNFFKITLTLSFLNEHFNEQTPTFFASTGYYML